MKKFHILFILSVIFLNSCKEPEETYTYTLTGTAKTGNTRASISSQGKITWNDNDNIYLWTGSSYDANLVTLTQVANSSSQDNNTAIFSGNFSIDEPMGSEKVSFIHFGNYTHDERTNVKIHMGSQEGTPESIGKYHISKTEETNLTYSGGIYVFNVAFKSYTSVARFDLSKYAGQKIKISWKGQLNKDNELYGEINNCYVSTYVPGFCQHTKEDGTDGSITITNPSDDTYVCFLPQIDYDWGDYNKDEIQPRPIENTVVTFSNAATNEVIGTVTFPNGIKSGKLYTGPGYTPIKIESRDIITETEI